MTVRVKFDETGKAIVYIITPASQKELTIKEMAHVLIGGVTLLIKSCEIQDSDSGIKDHELMKEIYTHLEDSFISDEFSDAESFLGKNKRLGKK